VLVVDCKTGAEQPWHSLQMMIYMLCLPHARKGLAGKQIEVPCDALDDGFRAEFKRVMGVLGGAEIPMKAPSPLECRYCNISPGDCPERLEPRRTRSCLLMTSFRLGSPGSDRGSRAGERQQAQRTPVEHACWL
jgi:hypothetical protein